MTRVLGCLLFFLLSVGFPSLGHSETAAPAWRVVPERIIQGGIVTVTLQSASAVRTAALRLNGRDIPLQPDIEGRFIVWLGVDLDQPPGAWDLPTTAVFASGESVNGTVRLLVENAGYPIQRLTVPRTFTELDAQTLERIAREKDTLDRIWETWTPERYWQGAFQAPVGGTGTGFGVRRIINGEPRSPHTGQDYAAPAGAPVAAANAGRVVVEADQFFSGKSLVIDHGQGLYTMYFHLAEFLAPAGHRVAKGDIVARVGSTGRVTGPHLHWGARLNGARINPEALLRLAD